MIYELFMLNNEIDLLEIKLEELYDFVDKFIIIESTHTHSNLPKKLHYVENEHRFTKYKDKIIHLVCNFSDTYLYRNHKKVYQGLNKEVTEIWYREHFQRDFGIISGQIKFDDEDIIIVTDLDEIIDKKAVSRIINETEIDKIYRLEMSLHFYKFNLRVPYPVMWRHSFISRYKHLKNFNFAISYVRHNYKFLAPEYFEILLERMGWHFTYLMSPNDIVNKKLKQFAHAEDTFSKETTVEMMESNIQDKKFWVYNMEVCPITELPNTVSNLINSEKFIKFFESTHP